MGLTTRLRSRQRPVVWDIPEACLLFVQVPKVATRSMRAALAGWSFGVQATDAMHSRELVDRAVERYQRQISPAKIRRLARSRFAFAFVRNPLDRLQSAFADKVLRPTGEGIFVKHGITADTSFPEFVRIVAQLSDDDSCDRHLRSQHRFVSDHRGVVVDFVGRLEQVDQDWAGLAARFDLPPLPLINRTSCVGHRAMYTIELAEMAADRYRTDIERFGYRDEVDLLIQHSR